MSDLKTVRDRVKKERQLRRGGVEARVTVHMGTCGLASGAQEVMDRVLSERSRCDRANIAVHSTGCIGLCSGEPLVTVELVGKEPVIYQQVDDRKMTRIFRRHVLEGRVEVEFALARGTALNEKSKPMHSDLEGILPHISELKFFSLQEPRILRNKGLIDPGRIDDYIWRDGYRGATKAFLKMTPAEIISAVKESGLRNRSPRGLPTGIEWEFCAHSKDEVRYVVCTGDEGEPGASIGSRVLESDPHTVIEGMIIAAKAVGAHQGYISCRPEFSLAVTNLNLAIEQARAYGLLGKDILGSGFDFNIEVSPGAGAFACSEEAALLEAIEGGHGMPRPQPIFPAISGLWKKPTLLNNVETYMNIPRLILMGAERYADLGTESSKGTKLFYLAGKASNTGFIEVPMGTSLGKIIFDMGGGVSGGKRFKAVQLGGLSGGFVPPKYLNTPIDYDAVAKLGASLGSGSMIVTDDETCMVEMAGYFIDFCLSQVCGKCAGCRVQPERMQEILRRICRGEGRSGDIELLEHFGQEMKKTALCSLGQAAPDPVLSTVRYFRQEYEAHIHDKRCPAAACTALFRSPCQHTCPVGMDVPAYIALVRAGRIDDAYRVLKETNPFPSVCGRVCNHLCESKCRRGHLDEPVAIMHLKRYIADYAKRPSTEPLNIIQKEKVAIIGAGPSGLSAALELKRRGYGVTVFEELPEAGGMLRWCIPAFRLPRQELRREIEEILQTGVELRVNTRVGREVTFGELGREFDFIYLAVGAQKSVPLNIPGEDAEGVFGAVDFLRACNLGKEIKVGKHVAVVGGGIASVDAARTAIRLGAKKVTLYFRHDRDDIPGREWGLEAASEEGVQIIYRTAPVRVITQYGRARGLELTEMRLDQYDAIGRRDPKPILGSEFVERAETVLFAVGRNPDLGFLPEEAGIEISGGTVKVDDNLRTTDAKVWAGGDMVTGPATVIDAISAGLTAAAAIDTAVRAANGQEPWTAPAEEMLEVPLKTEQGLGNQARPSMPKAPPKIRRSDFREVELGYTLEMALAEACRCLRCDSDRTDPKKEAL